MAADEITPTERKVQITRELQALDSEAGARPLSDDAWARWQKLERELDGVEAQISEATA
jgi:hypothetical protein